MPIQQLPPTAHLVETGPVQFGDDYAGLFIRGAETALYLHALRVAIPYLRCAKYRVEAETLDVLCQRISACCENGEAA
jgi:hypothetical protein